MNEKRRTYFEILELAPKFHFAAHEIEERYHAGAKEHHPDRHVRDEAGARVASALHTAKITKAYRALRDPVKRAEYLLELQGIKISDERGGHRVDPAFLVDILELREALEDARAARDAARIGELGDEMRTREQSALVAIDRLFGRYEGGDSSVLTEIADALVALRYYRRFLDEIEAIDDDGDAHGGL